jgi:uncharacterized protein
MRPCTQCGKCCLKYGAELDTVEVKVIHVWRRKRPEIAQWAGWAGGDLYDLWVSPTTHEDVKRCPWLRKPPNQEKYTCRIYAMRPQVCRNYPVDIEQMVQDGCEMLEPGDLEKPREQLERELAVLRDRFMTYSVLLRDNTTGEVREYHSESDWDPEISDYVWIDGNYACDCNRALFFARAAGEDEPENSPCGVERFTALFAILPDGRRIKLDLIEGDG